MIINWNLSKFISVQNKKLFNFIIVSKDFTKKPIKGKALEHL